jgi:hypothetical protein
LSIGPLTYFENWFDTAKPNAYWIARYLPEEIDADKKITNARQVLNNSHEFISRSARKHVVTRTVMRYGTRKIAAVIAVIAFITLSSFVVRNYFRKQNDNVLKSIRNESIQIASKPKLSPEFGVPLLVQQLMLGNLDIPTIISQIPDKKQQIKIATALGSMMVIQGRNEPRNEILQAYTIADSLMEQLSISTDNLDISANLKLFVDYIPSIGQAVFFNPDKNLENLAIRNAKRSARWAKEIFIKQPAGFTDINFLTLCLENGINYKIYSPEEINQLLKLISPFENPNRSEWLLKNFDRDLRQVRGSYNYGIKFNGLYQELAYLYAATGNLPGLRSCMDSLLQYQETYFENNYSNYIDNERNIAGVFYTYGQFNKLDSFVTDFCARKKITPSFFYNHLVSQAMMNEAYGNTFNFYVGAGGQRFYNLNLQLAGDSMRAFFNRKLNAAVHLLPNQDEKNFTLAYTLKNEGCYSNYVNEIRGSNQEVPDSFFKQAVSYYQKVSPAYLREPEPVVFNFSSNQVTLPRKFMFLYPDLRVPFHPFEPRSLVEFYTTSAFARYLLDSRTIDSLYNEPTDNNYFEGWLSDYHDMMSSRDIFFRDPIPSDLLARILEKLQSKDPQKKIDLNVLYVHLADNAFRKQDTVNGIKYIQSLQNEKLLNLFQNKNYFFVNSYSLEILGDQLAQLAMHNRMDLVSSVVRVFRKVANRSSLYGYASQQVSRMKGPRAVAELLLDSARAEMNRIKNPSEPQPNRLQVAMALMYLNPGKNATEAYRIIKNSFGKFSAICFFGKAYGMHGELYQGKEQMPPLASVADRSYLLWKTIEGYYESQEPKTEWTKFNTNKLLFTRRMLDYVSEDQ